MSNDQRLQRELAPSINQLEGNGFSPEHVDSSFACGSQRGIMQRHGHLGCGRMPVSLLIASTALGIVVSGASGTISTKSQMFTATLSAGEIAKDRSALLASMYRSALHKHGSCGRYGSRLAGRDGYHSGFHSSAQRVAREIRGGSSSASSASDRYAARMQVMITRNMRKVLVEELDYLPEEVDDMDPQIAAVVIEKSLPRPRTGMPIVWRKSIRRKASSSSSPLAAMGRLLRTTVNHALGVLTLPLRALGRARDAGLKGVAAALVVLGAFAVAGTMVWSPEHKGLISGFAPHAVVTGIGEKVKARVPKRRRCSAGGKGRDNPSRTNASRGRGGRRGRGRGSGRGGAKSRSDKPAVPKPTSPSVEARSGSTVKATRAAPAGGSEASALSSERDGERASMASAGRSPRVQGRVAAASASAGAGGRKTNGEVPAGSWTRTESVDSVPSAKHGSDSKGRGSSGGSSHSTSGATAGANRSAPEIRRDADTGATERADGVDDVRSDASVETVYEMEFTPEDIPEEIVDADVDGDNRSPGRPRRESRPMAEHIPSEDELETWEKQMVEPTDTWLDKRIDSALDTIFGGKK